MKCIRIVSMILCFVCLDVNAVFAHSGRTDSNGGHTCRTNCAEHGLSTGEYHIHDDPYLKSLDKDTQRLLKDMETKNRNFHSTYSFPTPPNNVEVKSSMPDITQKKVDQGKKDNIDLQKIYNDNMNRIKELQKQNRISREASQYYIDTFKRENEARRERLLEMERLVAERRAEVESLDTMNYEEPKYVNEQADEESHSEEEQLLAVSEENDSEEEQLLAVSEENEVVEEDLSPEVIISIVSVNLAWIIFVIVLLKKRRNSK